ncbi:MAG: L-threonylcarbamoyladenylate synthase [Granulosicoccus sp.]
MTTAVNAIRQGGVIAYPTEAVFGLGCNPYDNVALQRIIDIKGRDAHKGFILIASSQLQLSEYLAPLTEEQQRTLDKHWPGPVTFVIPASEKIRGSLLAGYRDSLAVRVSTHPVVIALCEQYGGAIVSTSANRSGELALRKISDVSASMGAELDAIVDAPVGQLDSPTRIFDLVSGKQLR